MTAADAARLAQIRERNRYLAAIPFDTHGGDAGAPHCPPCELVRGVDDVTWLLKQLDKARAEPQQLREDVGWFRRSRDNWQERSVKLAALLAKERAARREEAAEPEPAGFLPTEYRCGHDSDGAPVCSEQHTYVPGQCAAAQRPADGPERDRDRLTHQFEPPDKGEPVQGPQSAATADVMRVPTAERSAAIHAKYMAFGFSGPTDADRERDQVIGWLLDQLPTQDSAAKFAAEMQQLWKNDPAGFEWIQHILAGRLPQQPEGGDHG